MWCFLFQLFVVFHIIFIGVIIFKLSLFHLHYFILVLFYSNVPLTVVCNSQF